MYVSSGEKARQRASAGSDYQLSRARKCMQGEEEEEEMEEGSSQWTCQPDPLHAARRLQKGKLAGFFVITSRTVRVNQTYGI